MNTMIKTKIFNVTELMTNCTYLVDESTGKSAVSDPGARNEKLIELIRQNGGKLEYIFLTHGHFDHIGFAKELAEMFSAKIVTGKDNADFPADPKLNLGIYHGIEIEPFEVDVLLADGDTVMLGDTEIKYITTPGHTKGCGCFIFNKTIIAGDTLFCESYGRTDLPTGDEGRMISSLKKLFALDGDYQVIPGHGSLTTLSHERKYNPLIRSF